MKKFFILLLFAGVFAGCKDDSIAPDNKKEEQTETMEITDIQVVDFCFKTLKPKDWPVIPEIISSDSIYKTILGPVVCAALPQIDFSKRTLSRVNIEDSNGPLSIVLKGWRNDTNKIYTVIAETGGQIGFDPIYSTRNIWFTIPKILPGYTIKAKQQVVGFITLKPSTYEIITSGTSKDLLAVSFGDSLTGFIAGASGTLLKTINGGLGWNTLSSGTTKHLGSIFAVSPNVVYACGSDGIILKSSNGGSTWIQQSSGTNTKLNGLFFKDELNGFAVGGRTENNTTSGIVLKTSDGGETWATIPSTGSLPLLYSVSFQTPDYGVAVGQSIVGGSPNSMNIIRTSDGGTTWENISSGTNETLYGVTFADTSSKMSNSQIWKREYGWVVGSNGTILTTDFTKGWKRSNSRTIEDLYCIGNALQSWPTMAFTGGKNGSVYRSVDDGDSWFDEKTGSLKTLYSIANPTKYIREFKPAPSYAVGANGVIVKINHGDWY